MNSHFTTALAKSAIARTSLGDFFKMFGRIDATAASGTYYLQIFDSATLPADGTSVASCIMSPIKFVHTNGTDTPFDIDLINGQTNSRNGVAFANGLTWCFSTTEFTKTIVGANIAVANVFTV